MVYDREDGVMSVRFWQLGDQVHGDTLEWEVFFANRDAIKWCFGLVGADLGLLTRCASLYIVFDPCIHPWPPVLVADYHYGVITSWVSCSREVMILL